MSRLKKQEMVPNDILLVDSKKVSKEMVQRLLEHQGYRVASAENGQEAVDLLQAQDFNYRLIITETSMPLINGFDLIKIVKAASGIPVLVLSAAGDEHTVSEVFRLRADDFIRKPFMDMELIQRVRQLLSIHVPERSAPGSTIMQDLVEAIKETARSVKRKQAVREEQLAMRLAS